MEAFVNGVSMRIVELAIRLARAQSEDDAIRVLEQIDAVVRVGIFEIREVLIDAQDCDVEQSEQIPF